MRVKSDGTYIEIPDDVVAQGADAIGNYADAHSGHAPPINTAESVPLPPPRPAGIDPIRTAPVPPSSHAPSAQGSQSSWILPDAQGGIGDIFTAAGQQPPILSRTGPAPVGTMAPGLPGVAPVGAVTSAPLPAPLTAPVSPVTTEPLPAATGAPQSVTIDGVRVPVPPEIAAKGREAVGAWADEVSKPSVLPSTMTRQVFAPPAPQALYRDPVSNVLPPVPGDGFKPPAPVPSVLPEAIERGRAPSFRPPEALYENPVSHVLPPLTKSGWVPPAPPHVPAGPPPGTPDKSSTGQDWQAGLLMAATGWDAQRVAGTLQNRQRLMGALQTFQQKEAEAKAQGYPLGHNFQPQIAHTQRLLDDMNATLSTALGGIATRGGKLEQIPTNPAAERLDKATTWGDAFDALLDDPLGVARTKIVRGLPAAAPGLGVAAVGGAVAGPLGMAAASGISGAAMSIGGEALTQLRSYGADLKDPESVKKVFAAHADEIASNMTKRALIVGGADAAAAMVTGLLGKGMINSSLSEKLMRLTGGLGVNVAGGAGGEAGAEYATGQELQPGTIAGAGVAALPGTLLEAVTAFRARNPNSRISSPEQMQEFLRQTHETMPLGPDGKVRYAGPVAEEFFQKLREWESTQAQPSGLAMEPTSPRQSQQPGTTPAGQPPAQPASTGPPAALPAPGGAPAAPVQTTGAPFLPKEPPAGAPAAAPAATQPAALPAPTFQFPAGTDVNALPKGMRNNNPGNIKWKGQPGTTRSSDLDQGDPQAHYATVEDGMTGMRDLVLRKFDSGKRTVRDLIAGEMGWTPGSTGGAEAVARFAGIDPDEPINMRDPAILAKVMRGIITQEQGPEKGALYGDDLIAKIAGAELPAVSTDGSPVAPGTAGAPPVSGAPPAGQGVGRPNYGTVANMGDPKSPGWEQQNLTQIQAGGQTWQVNKKAAQGFQGLIDELAARGYKLKSGGGFNYRNIRGGKELSQHAFGNAIDINPEDNPLGSSMNNLPPDIREIAARHGLVWGGDFHGRKDPMHFEWAGGGDTGTAVTSGAPASANEPLPSEPAEPIPPAETAVQPGPAASAGSAVDAPATTAEPAPLPGAVTSEQIPEHTLATAAGDIRTKPIVLDMGAITRAGDEAFRPENQPRNRDKVGSEQQVQHIKSTFDPRQATEMALTPERGPPIVNEEGHLLAGHGRDKVLQQIYEGRPEVAAAYKQQLQSMGFNVSGMARPMLVHQVASLTPQQHDAIVHGTNAQTTLAMSAAETARSDTRHITQDMAASLASNPSPISNKTFLAGFMAKVPPNERGAMLASDGKLTSQGIQRIQNAVFAKAYGDSPVLERMSESADDNTKALSGAMREAGPAMLQLQAAIESGQVSKQMDPREDITAAVNHISRMREAGQSLDSYLSQVDAFNPIPDAVEGWMRAFYNEAGTRAASGKDVSTFMRFYVEEAMKQPAQGLDLGGPAVTPRQILSGAREKVRVERQGGADQGQLGGLEPGGPGPQAGGNEAGGGESRPSDGQQQPAQVGNGPDQTPAKAGPGEPRQAKADSAPQAVAGKPLSKAAQIRARDEKFRARVRDIYTPGNIVKGTYGIERIVDSEFDEQGRLVSVTAQDVVKKGGEWVASGPERTHQTQPSVRDKILERAPAPEPVDADTGDFEADAPPDLAKKKWKAKPKVDAYDKAAWTNRLSRYEDVFVAAVGSEEAAHVSLYPPERQFNIAARQTESAFGIAKIEKTPKAQTRHAIDQLKDAYRSMGHMAEVIGFNPTAIGLDGHFGIVLRKLGRGEEAYYGAFYRKGTPPMEGLPGKGAPQIVLPERTNSFGHEWAHALDHYVNAKLGLGDMPGMLSEHVKKLKDRTFKQNSLFTPELTDVARAMGQVYEAMTIGADGKPTQFAIESLDYGQATGGKKGAAYYGSAREMLARSFEAWLAEKVAQNGGGLEALTKDSRLYGSDADERFLKTFPKNEDRLRVFAAMDALMGAVSTVPEIAGKGKTVPMGEATASPDAWDSSYGPSHTPTMRSALKNDSAAVGKAARAVGSATMGLMEAARHPGATVLATGKLIGGAIRENALHSMKSQMEAINSRINADLKERGLPPSKAMREFIDIFAATAGSRHVTGETFLEARDSKNKHFKNELSRILSSHKYLDERTYTPQDADVIHDLLVTGGSATGGNEFKLVPSNATQRAAAVQMRQLLDKVWYYANEGGVPTNYTRNGYLPRVYNDDAIEANRAGFETQASKVYEHVFARDIAKDSAELMQLKTTGEEWDSFMEAARAATKGSNNSLVPQTVSKGDYNALRDARTADAGGSTATTRQLLQEAVDRVFDDVKQHFSDNHARMWSDQILSPSLTPALDHTAPPMKFTKGRKLPPEADMLLKDYMETDPITLIARYTHQVVNAVESRRYFGEQNSRIDALFKQMASDGLTEPDRVQLRKYFERMSGQEKRVGWDNKVQQGLDVLNMLGTAGLLTVTTFNNLGESSSVALRTGRRLDVAKGQYFVAQAAADRIMRWFGGSGLSTVQYYDGMAQMFGAIHDVAAENLISDRMHNADVPASWASKKTARMYEIIGIGALTRWQRAMATRIGVRHLREMGETLLENPDDEMANLFFSEMGIPEGPGQGNQPGRADFARWMLRNFPDRGGQTPLSDMRDDPNLDILRIAMNRFTDQAIQEPKSVNKPYYAGTPIIRNLYGLLSFGYAMHENLIMPIFRKLSSAKSGLTGARKARALGAAAGVLLGMFVTHALYSMFRSTALDTPERRATTYKGFHDIITGHWSTPEAGAFFGTVLARMGILHLAEAPVVGAINKAWGTQAGGRYDPSIYKFMAGPAIGNIVDQAQKILAVFGNRNSANTTTAEFQAARGVYTLANQLAMPLLLGSLPVGGPLHAVGWAASVLLRSGANRDTVISKTTGMPIPNTEEAKAAQKQATKERHASPEYKQQQAEKKAERAAKKGGLQGLPALPSGGKLKGL